MARITNTDTLPFVSSRYELGMLSAQRVRDLNGGAEPLVPVKGDKQTVTSLREIASGKLDIDNLRHEFIQSYKNVPVANDTEGAIESKSEDPLLKEIDVELESAIVESDEVMPVEEIADEPKESTSDSVEE
ncbi:MAG: DNA-directed RNA polymerase subunit omega [Alphaproteobacteria bacterium]|nr:DNA-directed RNA polymerase subunit omega [Alphaproteobacteria bacterium]